MRVVLEVVFGPLEAMQGMGWSAGERKMVFYADDRRIAGRDQIWVQDTLVVTVAIFRKVGLDTNPEKTKALL